jgi:hypothetical protein
MGLRRMRNFRRDSLLRHPTSADAARLSAW